MYPPVFIPSYCSSCPSSICLPSGHGRLPGYCARSSFSLRRHFYVRDRACSKARLQKPLAQMPASARQLIAIKVVGSKRFPEAAIAAATGLQMGTAVD
jgi:hypothetical protein